jgi:hypothetical protein
VSKTVNGRAGPARLRTAHGPAPTAQRLWPHAHGELPPHESLAGSPRVGLPPLPPPAQRGDAHPLVSVAKSWPCPHDTEVVSFGHAAIRSLRCPLSAETEDVSGSSRMYARPAAATVSVAGPCPGERRRLEVAA